jgi:dolichol-phosphate mannosyltransferase
MIQRTLIFIPTYNEKDNVEKLISEIQALHINNADLLFIDDNSTDGTGDILDRIAKEQSKLYVVHRSGKLGVGSAHKDGIAYAYQKQYDILITMDADFTHSPSYITKLLERADTHDIVVTSRYMEKDSLKDWNLFRKTVTWFGHSLTRYVLGLRYDASGAFRLYNLNNINRAVFVKILSNGYSFFFESLFILNFNKYRIVETPIILSARTYGNSKMKISDAFKSLEFLFTIFLKKVFQPHKFLIAKNGK